MELTKQVTSLEISKRLKELGVKQESLFYWCPKNELYEIRSLSEVRLREGKISAFTVAELGEMLPSDYFANQSRTVGGGFRFDFGDEEAIYDKTEADARGKMLIYLLENKLITTPTKE